MIDGVKAIRYFLCLWLLLTPYAHGEDVFIEYLGGGYIGELVDGVPHGRGTWTVSDGQKYVGDWKGGNSHGQGTYTYADGSKYIGEWKEGEEHGEGTLTSPDGKKYVGEWKDGKKHGQGSLTLGEGTMYVGEFKDDRVHGQGTMTWPDGKKYVGEWENYRRTEGTYTWPNAGKYVGEFKNDKQHGHGTYTNAEGDQYVGEWKNGEMHGQGTYTWPNAGKYVGEHKNGKEHGQGTYTYVDGSRYAGGWKDGKKHGQGTWTELDGAKFVGELRLEIEWEGIAYNAAGEVTYLVSNGMPAPACDGIPSTGGGTGFAVSQHHVVTNAHVLYCCKKVTVYDTGSCSDGMEATIVTTEQKSDLGLLRLGRSLKHYATLRSGKELQLGERVSTYVAGVGAMDGCPKYVVRQGKVTELNWMPDDSRLMRHDSLVRPGSSGGPVLDVSGHIIGVTEAGRGKTADHKQQGDAVKLHLLEAFLKTNNVEYRTAASTEKLSLSEIKKKSDKFTVIIDCIQ